MSNAVNENEQSAKQDKNFGKAEVILILITILLALAVVLYNFINASKKVQPVIVYASVSSQTDSESSGNSVSVNQSEESEISETVSATNLAHETESSAHEEIIPQSSKESTGIGIININTASANELDKLPGIGAVKAAAIVDYRTEYGNFDSIEEITNVSGIGIKTFEKIKEFITVG